MTAFPSILMFEVDRGTFLPNVGSSTLGVNSLEAEMKKKKEKKKVVIWGLKLIFP
jgi:hypothetical protein